MFHYAWLEGSAADGLSRQKTVVLTESVARKFFGNSPALNQVINYNNKYDLTVSGVVKDAPLNTSFPFAMIISNKLGADRSEEHTSELQSHSDLVCRLLLEKKKKREIHISYNTYSH